MTKGQFRLIVVLTIVFGFLGGAVSNLVFRDAPALAAGTAVPVQDEVRARKFVLVDDAGKERARLDLSTGFPGLRLIDDAGKERASLDLTGNLPTLSLCDFAGNQRVALQAFPDAPMLTLVDAKGQPRVFLSLGAEGSPVLGLHDAAGKTRAQLTVSPDGRGGLTLYDVAGRDNASLSPTALALGDPELKHNCVLLTSSLSTLSIRGEACEARLYAFAPGGLSLSDDAGKTRATLDLFGGPNLTLLDAAGNERTVVGCTALANKVTDAKTEYPESTLTLFKANGDVLWQAP